MKKIRYTSPICQEAPRGRICTKFATAVGVADVITSNKFLVIGQGVRILWGSKIALSHWQSQSPLAGATAQPVIKSNDWQQYGFQSYVLIVTNQMTSNTKCTADKLQWIAWLAFVMNVASNMMPFRFFILWHFTVAYSRPTLFTLIGLHRFAKQSPWWPILPNFVSIGQTVAEISRFLRFSRWRTPPSDVTLV